jgi:ankyrin repeat protein
MSFIGGSCDGPWLPKVNALQLFFNDAKYADYLSYIADDAKTCDENGVAPLHIAVNRCSISFARKLIDLGADVNQTTGAGGGTISSRLTPVHFAASACRFDMIRLLLSRGANIDARDDLGDTALFSVIEATILDAQEDELICIKVLLDAGADIESTNNYNLTPLSMAITRKKLHIVEYLLGRGARISTTGNMPLGVATSLDTDQFLLLLLSHPDMKLSFESFYQEHNCGHTESDELLTGVPNYNRAALLLLIAASMPTPHSSASCGFHVPFSLAAIMRTYKVTIDDLAPSIRRLTVARRLYTARTSRFVLRCAVCKCDGVLACSGCCSTTYCSVTCQHKDWTSHRKLCSGKTITVGTGKNQMEFTPLYQK